MTRPKKSRLHDGLQLPDNLYPDPRKRRNFWLYLKPDNSKKIFQAESTAQAIEIAEEANALRDTIKSPTAPRAIKTPDHAAIAYWVERFILWRENYDQKVTGQAKWPDKCSAMRTFAKTFSHLKINTLTLDVLRPWWEALTHHGQHNRRPEFERLFNFFMLENLTPKLRSNPFSAKGGQVRLLEKSLTEPTRARLSLNDFWIIYDKAEALGYACLQIAMAISLLTTMRRGDICSLEFKKHIDEKGIRKTINKSKKRRSGIHTHLEFSFNDHPLLVGVIQQAREASFKNKACPYVISHAPDQKRIGKTKTHAYQVTPERLTKMFLACRQATSLYKNLPANTTPPTFHEIRGLSSDLFDDAGYSIEQIQKAMAHRDKKTTEAYRAGHKIKFTTIDTALSAEVIKGRFFEDKK